MLLVGTMRTMTLTDMLRCGGVIIQAIATVSCLAVDLKNPVADPTSKVVRTNLQQQTGMVLLESKRVVVSVETARRTCSHTTVLFIRDSPPPWKDGNRLGLRFPKASVPGQIEEWEDWRVVNMHTENFFEVATRLKMSSVEVQLLRIRVQEFGHQETTASYAVVTDARIPRGWYLSWPGENRGNHVDLRTAGELKASYAENFRAAD